MLAMNPPEEAWNVIQQILGDLDKTATVYSTRKVLPRHMRLTPFPPTPIV